MTIKFVPQDHYFKKAKKENYLARSIYKLKEIDEKFKILKKGDHIIDLGYHPGSWIQYVTEKLNGTGLAIGIDLKPVQRKLLTHANIHLFEKDIFDIEDLSFFSQSIGTSIEAFNVVLSDMAPNTSGIRSLDQDRSFLLVEKIFTLLPVILKPGGHLVIKVFDGNDVQMFLKTVKSQFQEFHSLKPKSTRSISKEFFIIGKKYVKS